MAPGALGAGLTVTVSGAPVPLIAGDTGTLTATVTNESAVDAEEATAVFIAGFGSSSSLPILQVLDPTCQEFISVSCPLGTLAPGASRSATIGIGGLRLDGTVQIGATGQSTNVGGSETALWEGQLEPKADTKLELTASAESVVVGASVTVRGLVTNTRQFGTAYGAQVKFSIPPDIEVVSRPADCTGSVLNLVCPVGDLGPLVTAQRELTLRSTTAGSFAVVGVVTWARPDTTPADTQGQVNVSVQPPPDTTPVPEPAPVKPATPKPRAASAGSLVQGLPASGSCRRSRRLSLVLRSRGTWDPVRATIRVTGRKRALVLKGARAQRPFTLTLPRRGRVKISVEVTLDNGRRYKASRSFRRC